MGEFLEVEEDATAPGLLQRSAGRNQEGPDSGSAPARDSNLSLRSLGMARC